jgi:phosphate starvation-inducible PhoH-like protein
LREFSLCVAVGSAGTGKTYISANFAASQLSSGAVDKIIITRPNLSTGKSLGYFPGTIEDKLSCWLMPVISVLKERFGSGKYEYLLNNDKIILQPLETIRGQSFENSFIIVDESQNLSVEEIKALSTRLGENSKLVFLGDLDQRDVRESGLEWFISLCHKHELDIPVVHFNSDDIVRSDLVKSIVKAFEAERKK